MQCEPNAEVIGKFSFVGNTVTIDLPEGNSQQGEVFINQNLLTIRTNEDSGQVERNYKRVATPRNTITIE